MAAFEQGAMTGSSRGVRGGDAVGGRRRGGMSASGSGLRDGEAFPETGVIGGEDLYPGARNELGKKSTGGVLGRL